MQETKKPNVEKKVVDKPKKVEEKKLEEKTKPKKEAKDHIAYFKAIDLPISTKASVEICNYLRNRPLDKAKAILNQVINKKMAIPYRRYNRDMGHKPGIAAGRYPEKAAKHILKVLNADMNELKRSSKSKSPIKEWLKYATPLLSIIRRRMGSSILTSGISIARFPCI